MTNGTTKSSSVTKRVRVWLRSHGDIVGLVGLMTGVAVGVGIPVWQNYYVEQPELSVEINAINRTISSDAGFPAEDELLSVILRSERSLVSGSSLLYADQYTLTHGPRYSRP